MSEFIRFNCPQCNKRLKVKSTSDFASVQCSGCHAEIKLNTKTAICQIAEDGFNQTPIASKEDKEPNKFVAVRPLSRSGTPTAGSGLTSSKARLIALAFIYAIALVCITGFVVKMGTRRTSTNAISQCPEQEIIGESPTKSGSDSDKVSKNVKSSANTATNLRDSKQDNELQIKATEAMKEFNTRLAQFLDVERLIRNLIAQNEDNSVDNAIEFLNKRIANDKDKIDITGLKYEASVERAIVALRQEARRINSEGLNAIDEFPVDKDFKNRLNSAWRLEIDNLYLILNTPYARASEAAIRKRNRRIDSEAARKSLDRYLDKHKSDIAKNWLNLHVSLSAVASEGKLTTQVFDKMLSGFESSNPGYAIYLWDITSIGGNYIPNNSSMTMYELEELMRKLMKQERDEEKIAKSKAAFSAYEEYTNTLRHMPDYNAATRQFTTNERFEILRNAVVFYNLTSKLISNNKLTLEGINKASTDSYLPFWSSRKCLENMMDLVKIAGDWRDRHNPNSLSLREIHEKLEAHINFAERLRMLRGFP